MLAAAHPHNSNTQTDYPGPECQSSQQPWANWIRIGVGPQSELGQRDDAEKRARAEDKQPKTNQHKF